MNELFKQVVKEFEVLRANNSKPSLELRAKVATLLHHFPRKYISDAVKVKPGTLTNWKTRYYKNNIDNKFIELPINLPTTKVTINNKKIINGLEVILPNNLKIVIKNNSLTEFVDIIKAVAKEFNPCSI